VRDGASNIGWISSHLATGYFEEQGTVLVLFKQRSRVKNRNTELISAVILANLTMNYTAYSTQTVQ